MMKGLLANAPAVAPPPWPRGIEPQKIVLPCPEDITIDPENGRAYVSSQAAVRSFLGGPANRVQGAIFAVDLDSMGASAKLHNITAHVDGGPRRFHPLGLDLFIGEDGRARLFVINRTGDRHSRIEIFDVDRTFDLATREQRNEPSSPLTYRGYVADDLHVMAPNGIAATAMNAFLVTNMSRFRCELLRAIDTIPFIAGGSMVHCTLDLATAHDPAGTIAPSSAPDEPQYFGAFVDSHDKDDRRAADFHFLDEGLRYPNGIAVSGSPTPQHAYVASTLDRKIRCYDWDGTPERAAMTFTHEIDLPAAPDNLKWDQAGNLWLGAHPSLIKLVQYMYGGETPSPSEVLRVSGINTSNPVVESIWSDDGRLLSASSAAVPYQSGTQKVLLIGSAFQDRLLVYHQ